MSRIYHWQAERIYRCRICGEEFVMRHRFGPRQRPMCPPSTGRNCRAEGKYDYQQRRRQHA